MIYIYGDDYIKYLNDDSAGKLTYDQWKSKKSYLGSTNSLPLGISESAKYTKGFHAQGGLNKKYRV